MEFLGHCLDTHPSDGSAILPFGGGMIHAINFFQDGRFLLASGELRSGLHVWNLPSKRNTLEYQSAQQEAKEEWKRKQQERMGIEAKKESERERKHIESEREKSRAFAIEMDAMREAERNELEAERQCIVDDGGDLLSPSGSLPAYGGATARRRPSELHSRHKAPATATSRTAGAVPPPAPTPSSPSPSVVTSPTNKLPSPSSSSTSHSRVTPAPVKTEPASVAVPPVVGWLDAEEQFYREQDKATKRSKRQKRRDLEHSDSDDDDTIVTSPHRNEAKKTPKSISKTKGTKSASSSSSSSTKLPSVTPVRSGAVTVRPSLIGSSKKDTPHAHATGSATARESKPTATVTTKATPIDTTTTANKSLVKSAKKSIDPVAADASVVISPTRREKVALRRRRLDSDDPAPDACDDTNVLSSRRLNFPNDSSSSSSNNNSGVTTSSDGTRRQSIPTRWAYSDFDTNSLAHRLRIPHCLVPYLSRPFSRAYDPLTSRIHLQPNAFWSLSRDETMLVYMRLIDTDGTPCKKLIFHHRMTGEESISEKSHSLTIPTTSLTLTEDGRKCLVGTQGGHCYLHTFESTRWTYIWLKLRDSDELVPTYDLQFSPNGLTFSASRSSQEAPLTVWNVKTGKMMAMCRYEEDRTTKNMNTSSTPPPPPPPAASPSSPSSDGSIVVPTTMISPSLDSSRIKSIWSHDSEHLFSIDWCQTDLTLRVWKTVTRSRIPRMAIFGRLNTPYTHVRTTNNFFSHALALSPNGKLLAVAYGLTLFIFNVPKQRCIQYVTLWDLMSVGEAEKDESIGRDWRDPYLLHTQQLVPSKIGMAHMVIPNLIHNDQPLPTAQQQQQPQPQPQQQSSQRHRTSKDGTPLTSNKRSSIGVDLMPQLTRRGSIVRDQTPGGVESSTTSNTNNNNNNNNTVNIPSSTTTINSPNKRSSLRMNSDTPLIARRGSMARGTNLNLQSSPQPPPPPSIERSAYALPLTDAHLSTSPPHLTPLVTHITHLRFHPSSSSLALGTSLGGLMMVQLSNKIQEGEEDCQHSDVILVTERRKQQRTSYLMFEKERLLYEQHQRQRQHESEVAEAQRAEQRLQSQQRAIEREERRRAREEARRLKLYVGSLPDLSYQPLPGKIVSIDPFFREQHVATLFAAVEEKGDFLVRLDEDLDGRRRRAEERRIKRQEEEEAALLSSIQPKSTTNEPIQREASRTSFMERLNRDLNKRKDFRSIADAGKYYRENSIIPQKVALPPIGK